METKLADLIEFIIETKIEDPILFKAKLIKKIRSILNEKIRF